MGTLTSLVDWGFKYYLPVCMADSRFTYINIDTSFILFCSLWKRTQNGYAGNNTTDDH